MKEPGQMLWELQRSIEQMHWPWCNVADGAKAAYAAVEAAIRADEAAKVRAEAIEAIKSCGSLDENGYICTKSDAIKAIRALRAKAANPSRPE